MMLILMTMMNDDDRSMMICNYDGDDGADENGDSIGGADDDVE